MNVLIRFMRMPVGMGLIAVVLTLIAGFAVPIAGCAGPKVVTKSAPDVDRYRMASIVVMPFETLATPQVTRLDGRQVPVPEGARKSDITMTPGTARDPLRQRTASVPPAAGMRVAQIFSGKLRARSDIVVRTPAEAELALAELRPSKDGLTSAEATRRVAAHLKVDAALTGLVRVYRERVGSKYGAEPAAVGFEIKLVAADGRVLWVGEYYEAQRPVTEDFPGFLERGVGFVTAEELARYGAEQLIRQFPF